MFDNNDFNYLEFKRLYENGVGELDFIMIFNNSKTEYVITKRKNFVDFSHCSSEYSEVPEILTFEDLDELYGADLLDGINLKRVFTARL